MRYEFIIPLKSPSLRRYCTSRRRLRPFNYSHVWNRPLWGLAVFGPLRGPPACMEVASCYLSGTVHSWQSLTSVADLLLRYQFHRIVGKTNNKNNVFKQL